MLSSNCHQFCEDPMLWEPRGFGLVSEVRRTSLKLKFEIDWANEEEKCLCRGSNGMPSVCAGKEQRAHKPRGWSRGWWGGSRARAGAHLCRGMETFPFTIRALKSHIRVSGRWVTCSYFHFEEGMWASQLVAEGEMRAAWTRDGGVKGKGF